MAETATYSPYAGNMWLPTTQQPSLSQQDSGVKNSAAYGQVPAPVQPLPTIGSQLPQAIAAGNQVASQLPGYATDLSNVGANITSETAGEIPASVLAQLGQNAASSGVATGTSGGAGNMAGYLRGLGLESLQETQTGQQDLQSMVQSLPGYGVANNPNFYTTTGQQYESGVQNNLNAAAPNPYAAAMAGLAATGQGMAAGGGGFGARPSPNPASYLTPVQANNGQPNPPAVTASGSGTGGEFFNGVYYQPGQTPPGTTGTGTSNDPWTDIINKYAGTVGAGNPIPGYTDNDAVAAGGS